LDFLSLHEFVVSSLVYVSHQGSLEEMSGLVVAERR